MSQQLKVDHLQPEIVVHPDSFHLSNLDLESDVSQGHTSMVKDNRPSQKRSQKYAVCSTQLPDKKHHKKKGDSFSCRKCMGILLLLGVMTTLVVIMMIVFRETEASEDITTTPEAVNSTNNITSAAPFVSTVHYVRDQTDAVNVLTSLFANVHHVTLITPDR